jgi:ribosomal protein S27E
MIHSLAAIWALEKAAERRKLTRGCPKCRNRQTVAQQEREKSAACQKCGETIPPKVQAKK